MAVAADRNPWMQAPGADPKNIRFYDPDGGMAAVRAGNAITHQEDGCVEDLKEQHPVILRQDEQLVIGGIDTTTAIFCKLDVTVEPAENTDMAAENLAEMANDVKEFIIGLGPGVSIAESELKAMLLSDPRVKDAIVEIKMYLPSSSDSEEDVTDDRRRAGIWHINPSECADISPIWPVVIKFKQTAEA